MTARARSVPLVRVALVREPSGIPYRTQASDVAIAHLAHEAIGRSDREHILVYLLDVHKGFLGVHTAAIGALNTANLEVGATFRAALLACAHSMVLAHNHPGGDPVQSRDDRTLFDRMRQAGELLGVQVLDSVLVTPDPGTWSSLKGDRELLERVERDRRHAEWDQQRLARRQRANRSPEEREAFAVAVAEGKASPGDLVEFPEGSVTLRRLAKRLYAATAPLPDPVREALGLRPGATYAVASRRLIREWKKAGIESPAGP